MRLLVVAVAVARLTTIQPAVIEGKPTRTRLAPRTAAIREKILRPWRAVSTPSSAACLGPSLNQALEIGWHLRRRRPMPFADVQRISSSRALSTGVQDAAVTQSPWLPSEENVIGRHTTCVPSVADDIRRSVVGSLAFTSTQAILIRSKVDGRGLRGMN